MFLAAVETETRVQSGIYSICGDDSSSHLIASVSDLMPDDTWWINSIALSPDRRSLAISMNEIRPEMVVTEGDSRGAVYLLDLQEQTAFEIYAGEFTSTDIAWTPDGQYVSIVMYPEGRAYSSLEVIHLATGVTSQLVDGKALSNDHYITDIAEIDWSPAGNQIIYQVLQKYVDEPLITSEQYIASVTCDPESHQCSIETPVSLSFESYGTRTSWFPDGRLVATVDHSREHQVSLEARSLDGSVIHQISFQMSDLEYSYGDPAISPDATLVAVLGYLNGQSGLLILGISDREMKAFIETPIEGSSITEIEWLP